MNDKPNPTQSDTPRTDAEIKRNVGKLMSVSSGFARQLERELKTCRADALREAADVAVEYRLWGKGRTARGFYDAILSLIDKPKEGK